MAVERTEYPPLMIDGLSYSDWEDEADRLRQLATGTARVLKKHVRESEKLLASLQDELDAIDGVSPGLTGLDAVRVGCLRELLMALRISVLETSRLLETRAPKRAGRSRQAVASS